jgi:hypothetical protein
MAQSIVKFLVRRGTDAERKSIVLADGELGATTADNNSKRLFVGDGVKPGGWPVASKFYLVKDFNDSDAIRFIQPGDLMFLISTSAMYALTGNDNTSLSDYLKVSQL